MKTKDIMTRDPMTCRTTETLDRAAQLMRDHDIGYVPVIGETGQVCGVITDRDICLAALSCGTRLADIPVGGAMSGEVVTASAEEEIEDVELRMRDHQIRRVPVVDASGVPVGVLSLNDIALAYQRAHLSAHEVASTLAAISQHNHQPDA